MEHAEVEQPPESALPLPSDDADLSTSTQGANGEGGEGNVEMIDMDDSLKWNAVSDDYDDTKRPSNEKLLTTAFVSFMAFTICQTVAAVIAGSQAMMGDSAAMFVDAMTYLFNLVAERKKNNFEAVVPPNLDPARARRVKQRAKRKMTLYLELVPPIVSVTTLIAVTIVVLHKAIRVLILDITRDRAHQSDPNINLMLFFSTINLGLDFLNVCCFAKAKHLMGFETMEGQHHHHHHTGATTSTPERPRGYEYLEASELGMTTTENGQNGSLHSTNGEQPTNTNGDNLLESDSRPAPDARPPFCSAERRGGDSTDSEESEGEGANLNMCSAYTHVFADTLRSIAVIIAAGIAEVVDGVTPEEADATAAVVVSALILLSLIPLFHGLVTSFSELRAIQAEESSERMFPEETNRTSELV